jgi:hypothetical protein
LPGTDHLRRERITHTFTAGASGLAFAFERGGRFHQMPIDWYPRQKKWGLDPGFVNNARFSQILGATCIDCHSEPVKHVAGNPTMIREAPRGIGCERCHGPGEKHLETAAGADIVQPRKLSVAAQVQLCAQCHVEGVAEVPSSAGHATVWVEEKAGARFGLVSAADRMVRSACFRAGGMTCTSCHDAHGGKGKSTKAVCASCHADKKCSVAPAGDCASCHMARATPSDFAERVPAIALSSTDHWIRRKVDAPANASPSIVPFAKLLGDDRPPPRESRALALFLAGRDPLPDLLELAAAPPREPLLFRAIGDAYAAMQNVPRLRAARAMELTLAPDDVDVLVRYGKSADDRDAERALRRALAIEPDDEYALLDLGKLLLRTRREDEGFLLLKRAARVGTDVLDAHLILALRARQSGDRDAAVDHLRAALRESPRDPAIREQLSSLLRPR